MYLLLIFVSVDRVNNTVSISILTLLLPFELKV